MGKPHEEDYDSVEDYERDLKAWKEQEEQSYDASWNNSRSNDSTHDRRNRYKSQDNEDYTPPRGMPSN